MPVESERGVGKDPTLDEKFNIVLLEGMATKNCVVVKEGENPSLEDITSTAINNEAFVSGEDDEAGDDAYMVQFPGYAPELLSDDQIRGKIREILGVDGE